VKTRKGKIVHLRQPFEKCPGRIILLAGLSALLCVLPLRSAQTLAAIKPADVTPRIAGAPRHPTVFLAPEDVARGRANVAKYAWARELADLIKREADRWLQRDDEWLRRAVPDAGAAFAYGLQACPICGADWGPFARGGASFDNPGHVTCTRGHALPDAEHPDPGTGYKGPDGRIHYFVGSYNAWAVETLTFGALEYLVHAYTLTGDERYAAKASIVLDAIAAIYPGCDTGCWDYPSSPPSGRLDRPWYQASRVLVHFVDQYDQLHPSPSLDRPSVVQGLTRRANIERNLLLDGGTYCYEESKKGRLANGEADYLRGALAVGVCLGIPEFVRWAVDGPFGIRVLLANDIDRDGAYFEVTPMYSDHTRELFFTFAEPLLNCRIAPYPEGLDLYRHPKMRAFLEPHNLPLAAAGHMPRYGDAPPDLERRPVPDRPFDRSDYDFLEKLYARSTDRADRGRAGALLAWLANGRFDELRGLASTGVASPSVVPDRRISAGMSMYREPGDPLGGSFTDRVWLLFHAGDPPTAAGPVPADWLRSVTAATLLGVKGMAVLRAGEGRDAQGLLLRFGPSLVHGHLDDLNINYIARGYELTYDLGYARSAATQTQTSWAKQTVSHNLVVVDEKSQGEAGTSGGGLRLFAETPSVRAVEASAELGYAKQGVTLYRRLAALVGDAPRIYLLDLFRVRGGRKHDWVFHAPATETEFAGVVFGAEKKGSLAGSSIDWSAVQLADGDLAGHPGTPFWVAPPENGFGFLGRPRRGRAAGAWSADWAIDNEARVRVTMAAAGNQDVVTAVANGLYPRYPKARYVLARRTADERGSVFAAAIEPHGGAPFVRTVERLDVPGAADAAAPVLVKVGLGDGAADYVYSSEDGEARAAGGLTAGGRFVRARVTNGRLVALDLVGGTRFEGFGWRVDAGDGRWTGDIGAADSAAGTFETSADLPADGRLEGAVIVFSNPAYSRTTAHRVQRIEKAAGKTRVVLSSSFGLGIGRVDKILGPTSFASEIPHEAAYSDRKSGENGVFKGKRIVAASGASARVRAVRTGQPIVLAVDSTAGLKEGEIFEYLDVGPGDRFEILGVLSLTETPEGTFRRSGTSDAEIAAPAGVRMIGMRDPASGGGHP
jgi:hypothetical protein